MGKYIIRWALESDAEEILILIDELGADLNVLHLHRVTLDLLKKQLFCDDPYAFCIVVEDSIHKKLIGHLIFWKSYSVGTGPTLSIEDYYVKNEYRGLGLGRALMKALGDYSKLNRITMLILECNENNKTSSMIYEKLGFMNKTKSIGNYLHGIEEKINDLAKMNIPTNVIINL